MPYLLFIRFDSGLRHNAVYEDLHILHESILQLVEEEKLNDQKEGIPTLTDLENHLEKEDDFYMLLSNGTWFHIQELSEWNNIKV